MIYGLYLSAQGVQTASHRQDVVSNNIANAETVGFKKDLALFQQRRTALQEQGTAPARSNRLLEMLGGGVQINPTLVDNSQGEMEHTGSHLDVAIVGEGFLRVSDGGDETLLTRAGRMVVNAKGHLALANNENYEVLDPKGKPITLAGKTPPEIARDGTITQDKAVAGRIGLVAVPDKNQLSKIGGTMLAYPDVKSLKPAPAATSVRAEYVERANVEPSTELAQLMDAQRQLEANANMIRYQDQMLSKLCNEVGKIG
ncbi:MAG TPA: flagellar hook basal-body protein [Tepidisphaeraceae bacterium]|nr:flagellar hook basal-body protein [Tepidisphaeraceae bacterium]